jgi:hypothetical protein
VLIDSKQAHDSNRTYLYNILKESAIPKKSVNLIKMMLHYSNGKAKIQGQLTETLTKKEASDNVMLCPQYCLI